MKRKQAEVDTDPICLWGIIIFIIALALNSIAKGQDCPSDINGDGVVDVADLNMVLADWGPCEPPEPVVVPPVIMSYDLTVGPDLEFEILNPPPGGRVHFYVWTGVWIYQIAYVADIIDGIATYPKESINAYRAGDPFDTYIPPGVHTMVAEVWPSTTTDVLAQWSQVLTFFALPPPPDPGPEPPTSGTFTPHTLLKHTPYSAIFLTTRGPEVVEVWSDYNGDGLYNQGENHYVPAYILRGGWGVSHKSPEAASDYEARMAAAPEDWSNWRKRIHPY